MIVFPCIKIRKAIKRPIVLRTNRILILRTSSSRLIPCIPIYTHPRVSLTLHPTDTLAYFPTFLSLSQNCVHLHSSTLHSPRPILISRRAVVSYALHARSVIHFSFLSSLLPYMWLHRSLFAGKESDDFSQELQTKNMHLIG